MKRLAVLVLKVSIFFSLHAVEYDVQISGEGLPIINSVDEKDVLPGGFRMTQVITLPGKDLPNLAGLKDLNISGSSQFSELSLQALVKRIGRKNITIVNLRQEDTGFIEPQEGKGAIAFSYLMAMPWWTGENPKGNRSVAEIEAAEEAKMAAIKKSRAFTLYGVGDSYAPKDNHRILYKIEVIVKRALTEKSLVGEKGLGYFRLPDKKFGNVQFVHVDEFVNFVRALPEEEWLHFHCKKGQSRTTLFMIMYDMMRNADKVSAEDIIRRQGPEGLGGADLMSLPDKKKWDYAFKKQWKDFLFLFHSYAKESKLGCFKKSWKEWAQEKKLVEPSPILLDQYYLTPVVESFLPSESSEKYAKKTLLLNTLNETKLTVANFRSTQDLWGLNQEEFNQTGLTDFYASGSSQYTRAGLDILIGKLKKMASNLVVVDLRHDDHLFINGLDVSTFETKEALLKQRSPLEILEGEISLKHELEKQGALEILAIDTQYPKNRFLSRFTLMIKPLKIETPEEVVSSLGAHYLLIGSKRFSEVSDEDIARFISFYKTQPPRTWYHFHCKKGKSRTTLFMTMFDMMHNADRLSVEEIVKRQASIGGVNLFDITPKDPHWAHERDSKKQWVKFLVRFHKYCQENKTKGFEVSWTAWSKSHASFSPDIEYLVIDRTLSPPEHSIG